MYIGMGRRLKVSKSEDLPQYNKCLKLSSKRLETNKAINCIVLIYLQFTVGFIPDYFFTFLCSEAV